MTGIINVQNRSKKVTEIDIEGTIGIPEELQFVNKAQKVATYKKFKEQIDRIKSIASSEIVVNIRSTGGNINDAILIHDTLKASGKTIITRCFGYVASAATIIAQAASEGKREISKNALYLIHKSISASEGNSNNLSETIDLLNKTDEQIVEIYAMRSGLPADNFRQLMEYNNGNGLWLNAKETIERGLADTYIETSPIQNIRKKWNELVNLILKTPDDKKSEIVLNTNQILQNLDNDNDKLSQLKEIKSKIKPPETLKKEDPSYDEIIMSENARAYYKDVQQFNK